MPEELCDIGDGITLCYERFGDASDPPVLLVMGLATQMIAWREEFCEQLVERGFHVVRFDNRDIGRSTHMDGIRWPTLRNLLLRRFSRRQYTLADMADDTAGLIRNLGIAPAHVVGASMGGMIAQTLAARHPELVRSLTSIMSTTGSRVKGQPHPTVYRNLLGSSPREREAYADFVVKTYGLVGSPGFERDEVAIRELGLRSFDRGRNPAGVARQMGAILKSGNRTAELRTIKAPTLVLHGDRDKLVNVSGGRATAAAIPDAKLRIIEGMGHDLPRGAWDQIIGAIAEHAQSADRDRGRAPAAA